MSYIVIQNSFSKYLLNPYYMPGMVPGTENVKVRKKDSPWPQAAVQAETGQTLVRDFE